MPDEFSKHVEEINASLAVLLEDARRGLRGEVEFGVENVRQLRRTIEKMVPILALSPGLSRSQPEIAGQLNFYKSQLNDLQTTIHKLRIMLLARQASLHAGQSQNVAVSRWVGALRQTR